MISKMVDFLSEFIKPAFPSEQTMDFIVGNANNWGHSTYLILVEHYQTSLETRLEELTDLLTQDWKKAFEVAVRWVKRDLPRIPQEVIDHAEAVIMASGHSGLLSPDPGAGPTTNKDPADPNSSWTRKDHLSFNDDGPESRKGPGLVAIERTPGN